MLRKNLLFVLFEVLGSGHIILWHSLSVDTERGGGDISFWFREAVDF